MEHQIVPKRIGIDRKFQKSFDIFVNVVAIPLSSILPLVEKSQWRDGSVYRWALEADLPIKLLILYAN